VVARALPRKQRNDFSISIVIPCRNEKGNIESAIQRIPRFGKYQEIIFVDGHSTDGTQDEIRRVMAAHVDRDIKLLVQKRSGKGEAVREGFKDAMGDILMILDADLTVPPEDLPKFYRALASGKAEFLNGCRLVYPMEGEAMRLLNLIANKLFAMAFTWLLGERLKDTLCGTKVLFHKDYEALTQNRSYFGDFDPFGDFDLLFGASKLNLKIIEVPVRYRRRLYGETQISRFRHGLLLFRMVIFALRKIKWF
jgi:glycosyltransferase involved in cell wall biosynthesis